MPYGNEYLTPPTGGNRPTLPPVGGGVRPPPFSGGTTNTIVRTPNGTVDTGHWNPSRTQPQPVAPPAPPPVAAPMLPPVQERPGKMTATAATTGPFNAAAGDPADVAAMLKVLQSTFGNTASNNFGNWISDSTINPTTGKTGNSKYGVGEGFQKFTDYANTLGTKYGYSEQVGAGASLPDWISGLRSAITASTTQQAADQERATNQTRSTSGVQRPNRFLPPV